MEEDLSISCAHDKFFKETFSRKETMCSFITEYLPKSLTSKLNLETLAIQKDSFINKELAETFSDLVYSVELSGKKAYIYFLFEHKSYIDKWVMYQLLRGMVSIWDDRIAKHGKKKGKKEDKGNGKNGEQKNVFPKFLPVVVPIVIYHGEKEWNVENSLGHLFDCDDNIKHYIPEFKSEVYDISNIPENEIRGNLFLRAYMHFLNRTQKRTLNELLDIVFALLSEIYNERTKLDCFELFLRYFGSIAKPEEWENVNVTKFLSKQDGEHIMKTAADVFIERGIEKGKIEDAKMMLQMELTI
ncbi:MAG: Rpn family recombination-promoting nuclease/putative transposase, partial [Fibrobacter sp.]|nr:Rpn family recombination-promoting nuclease/putative transposase [Fibrobacter sp.]